MVLNLNLEAVHWNFQYEFQRGVNPIEGGQSIGLKNKTNKPER